MIARPKISVLLHNIRSAHNVGSIFRTADAAGVSEVYLSGYTPSPRDRFGRPNKEIAKTALGAEASVPWEQVRSPRKLLAKFLREKRMMVGVEQDTRALDYRTFRLTRDTVFVFGNEVRGLSKGMRDSCEKLVEIPMRGTMVRQAHHPHHTRRGKESLNVAVAAGVILFSVSR